MSDLIKREDAMKQITINPNNKRFYSEDFIKGFECGTKRQLEADKADRPQGVWIDDIEAESNGDYWANCSQCGMQIDVHENRGYYNYCPNCGARMKGADDDTN